MLEEQEIDLILLDYRLPDMDGLQVLKAVGPKFRDLPIIMMTAYSTVQSAVEAMKLGAYEYLIKPFGGDELVDPLRPGRQNLDAGKAEVGGVFPLGLFDCFRQDADLDLCDVVAVEKKLDGAQQRLPAINLDECSARVARGSAGAGCQQQHAESRHGSLAFKTDRPSC